MRDDVVTAIVCLSVFIAAVIWLLARSIIQTFYQEKRAHLKKMLNLEDEDK